uniref:Transmembrane protein 138 n=1 Tax=Phallusia mammillata TaxID=59560 RepID=A0A6F9DVK7_9ASCI|nr:transmembrane protein 138-like [Phallusia mammillata]
MEVLNYTLILTLQLLLLLYDLVINATIALINPTNVIQLVLFILQDTFIVFTLIILFLELFNTTTFQAGFIRVMLHKFRVAIIVTIIYLCLSIGIQAWTLVVKWTDPNAYLFALGGYYFLYIVQRGWSPIYYYYYKITALRLGDSRFYKSSEWLRNQMAPR